MNEIKNNPLSEEELKDVSGGGNGPHDGVRKNHYDCPDLYDPEICDRIPKWEEGLPRCKGCYHYYEATNNAETFWLTGCEKGIWSYHRDNPWTSNPKG